MRTSKLEMARWAISSTRWADGEEYDGARLRTGRQWLEDRRYYTQRIEARRRRPHVPRFRETPAEALTLRSELWEEEEFDEAWMKYGMRDHLARRKKCDALERQRNWLLRALTVREVVRALVVQWRRQPGHWAGVRRDLGLGRLTPWALRRTTVPSWLSTAVDEAANGRLVRRRRIAFERWKVRIDRQRGSQPRRCPPPFDRRSRCRTAWPTACLLN